MHIWSMIISRHFRQLLIGTRAPQMMYQPDILQSSHIEYGYIHGYAQK